MRFSIAEFINSCLIPLYFSNPIPKPVISDTPTKDGLLRQHLKEQEGVAG